MTQPSDESPELSELMALFRRKHPDGTPVYTPEEVRAFIPLLAIASGQPLSSFAPAVENALWALVLKAGFKKDTSTPDQVADVLAEYYEENPLNPDLLAEVSAFLEKVESGSFEPTGEGLAQKVASSLTGGTQAHVPIPQKNLFGEGDGSND